MKIPGHGSIFGQRERNVRKRTGLRTLLVFVLPGLPIAAPLAQPEAPEPIAATVLLEVDARLGADDLMELALEQFGPVFEAVNAENAVGVDADLTGRLVLWRYGGVPGAGWTCIADIVLELYSPDGELIFREVGRGCGGTRLRKGLFEAALADLVSQVSVSPAVREFVETGTTSVPPSSPRPSRLETLFEVATGVSGAKVTWDVALDPTGIRRGTVVVSDTRRRSRSVRQFNIRSDAVEEIQNPEGLPLGKPVTLAGSTGNGVLARVEAEQFRYDGSAWQPFDGFPPCFGSDTISQQGYCGLVVRGSVVDSPRRWRVEVIGGSGLGAMAIFPMPLFYRAPKLVVGQAPLTEAPYVVVLDRETATDFSPNSGVFSVAPGWQYEPWEIQVDRAGNAYVLAKTSRPQELRFAKIEFPALNEGFVAPDSGSAPRDVEAPLLDTIESGQTFDIGTIAIGESCSTCSSALAVDPETGMALVLSREKRDTWYATFIGADAQRETTALPDMVWPLKVLPGHDDRFYILGYLPLALGTVPGRLGIYSISANEPIRHEVTLSLNSRALLPPIGFERDPRSGSIFTVWLEDRDTIQAAWYDPR